VGATILQLPKSITPIGTVYRKKAALSDLEEQGLIKSFEYPYELGWNTLKDYFAYQGNTELIGSRDAIQQAFKDRLIEDGETWMEMFKSRNKTTHTYNEETENEVVQAVLSNYYKLFISLEKKMKSLQSKPT